jgi:hypothetical protein
LRVARNGGEAHRPAGCPRRVRVRATAPLAVLANPCPTPREFSTRGSTQNTNEGFDGVRLRLRRSYGRRTGGELCRSRAPGKPFATVTEAPRRHSLGSHVLYLFSEVWPEDPIAVAQQVLPDLIRGESSPKLRCGPLGYGIGGQIANAERQSAQTSQSQVRRSGSNGVGFWFFTERCRTPNRWWRERISSGSAAWLRSTYTVDLVVESSRQHNSSLKDVFRA